MKKYSRINFIVGLFITVLSSNLCAEDNILFNDIQERLRTRIEVFSIPPKLSVGQELIHASVALPLFYERRGYNLAWCTSENILPLADSLVNEIEKAYFNGLNPESYHQTNIKSIIDKIRKNHSLGKPLNMGQIIDLDLLLTDAFLIYGSHLLSGRVDPITIDSEWFTDFRQMDMARVLEEAITENNISGKLEGLLPSQPGYKNLRQALAQYRNIAKLGDWPIIPEGGKMQKGDQGERVIALRQRLERTGDLQSADINASDIYNEEVVAAVKNFQQRHGLDIDGVVGKETMATLNVPLQKRINTLTLNLERWRWLPQDLGKRNIEVNIANFVLEVIENNNMVFNMKAIVGRTYRRTPVFAGKMTYLVLNPYWNVPNTIAIKDILPQVKKDPEYLKNQGFDVMLGWGADMTIINPETINWGEIDGTKLIYWFRQRPGPLNALGQVKFMFPNSFNVYLHDTPAKGLFAKSKRDFSSGCIRIERPIELAEYVLRNDPKWTPENIGKALNTGEEQTVTLPEPLPVYILYWTAWVSHDGMVNFRKDIYNRDNALLAALTEKPPGLEPDTLDSYDQ